MQILKMGCSVNLEYKNVDFFFLKVNNKKIVEYKYRKLYQEKKSKQSICYLEKYSSRF